MIYFDGFSWKGQCKKGISIFCFLKLKSGFSVIREKICFFKCTFKQKVLITNKTDLCNFSFT